MLLFRVCVARPSEHRDRGYCRLVVFAFPGSGWCGSGLEAREAYLLGLLKEISMKFQSQNFTEIFMKSFEDFSPTFKRGKRGKIAPR